MSTMTAGTPLTHPSSNTTRDPVQVAVLKIYRQQSEEIGWDQFLRRCLSRLWGEAFYLHFKMQYKSTNEVS